MKNKKLNLLLIITLLCLSPNMFAKGKSKDASIIINFEAGKFDVSDKDLTALLNKLNKSKKYRILGYSCKEDNGSDVEQLADAERRAEAIENILIDNGFSQKNITTIAYDESSECKAVVIEIDE